MELDHLPPKFNDTRRGATLYLVEGPGHRCSSGDLLVYINKLVDLATISPGNRKISWRMFCLDFGFDRRFRYLVLPLYYVSVTDQWVFAFNQITKAYAKGPGMPL
ncbi:hypothetical protein PM082_019670 [Marasmius tenuissimus]|nr:hypothetical protein PM082_019670 [Marasmius tenuissimus]